MTYRLALLPHDEKDPPIPPDQFIGEPCVHCPSYDPETLDPRGKRCGKTATQVIFWTDGRVSPACGQHGRKALDADALALVYCVHPIGPPIVHEDTHVRLP